MRRMLNESVAIAVAVLALAACNPPNEPIVALTPSATFPKSSPSPTTASSSPPTVTPASPTTAEKAKLQVVAAAGDIACAAGANPGRSCQQKAVSDAIVADVGVTAVLTLGDNQYDQGTARAYRDSYDKSWGRFKPKTHPVPGNHEYQTANAAGYYDYFGSLAGPRGKGYYSYDIGGWHFIALNSEISTTSKSDQLSWLKADLNAHPAKCVAAYWHRPRWSTGSEHGDDRKVAPLVQALYDANADLVLSGHDHDYERFRPLNPAGKPDSRRGIVQIVSGLGGKSHYVVSGRSTTAAKSDTAYGYSRLVLHATSAEITFEPAVGTYRDSFTLNCH
jgi:hypothetical protein